MSANLPALTEVKDSTYDLLKEPEGKVEEPVEDLLKDDKKEEEVKEDDKEEVKEEVPEDETDEIKLEEPKEDELDLDADEEVDELQAAIQVPVSKKEILAKYPELFKDFPALATAYYEQKKYTELLPTLDDAKEVIEKASTLDKFTESIFSGSTGEILKIVKEEDPKAFGKIVDNYLPTLYNLDQKAYYTVIGRVANKIVQEMTAAGTSTNNEDLKIAAQLVQQYIFQSDKVDLSRPYNGNNDTQDPNIARQLEELRSAQEKHSTEIKSDISNKTDNLLKHTIHVNIDPKGVMSPYVKKNAINDCLNAVKESIKADVRFNKIIDSLWRKAAEQKYNSDALNLIKSTYLGKAKGLLKHHIDKTRNEALKGSSSRKSDETIEDRKGPIKGSVRPASEKRVSVTDKETGRRKSTFELLSE